MLKQPLEWKELRASHVPNYTENKLGIWIDRFGSNSNKNYDKLLDEDKRTPYRILGLYEISYVIKGDGVFYSPATGKLPFSKGACIIQFPDVPHYYYSGINDDEWERCSIAFNGPFIDQ